MLPRCPLLRGSPIACWITMKWPGSRRCPDNRAASAASCWRRAGFVLDEEGTVLANKDDPHSIKVFDPSIKGETGRFAYWFVKR